MNKETCIYYTVSKLEDILKDEEAHQTYEEIGCYECNGINKQCKIYKSIKKEDYINSDGRKK